MPELHKRTLGTPTAKEIVEAGRAGTLKLVDGKITTPKARTAQKRYEKARALYDEKAVPKIADLGVGGEGTQFAQWFAHYSGLNPKIAGAWVLAEGAGEGTTGGEAGKNNWLAAGYPAKKTPFSEAPFFNRDAKTAAKATVEWMQGKITGVPGYSYAASPGIRNALAAAKGKSPAQQAKILAASGWVDGNEGTVNQPYYESIVGNAANVTVMRRGGAPKEVRTRLKRAEKQAKTLGIPLQQGTSSPPVFVPGKGRYVFPFAQGWTESRTDMGKDYAYTHEGAPVRALGSGTIVAPIPGEAHWEGGNGLVLKLDHAKGLPSPYVFLYEGINPTVQPGQRVKKGQVVAKGGITGSIETGFSNAEGVPLAAGEYAEDGTETKYGKVMSNFLGSLAKGKTKIPASLLKVGGGHFATPSGALTPEAVTTFAAASGTTPKAVTKALKSKKLTPQTILQKLAKVERALGSNLTPLGIPALATPTRGPSVSDIAALGKSLEAGRQELAAL